MITHGEALRKKWDAENEIRKMDHVLENIPNRTPEETFKKIIDGLSLRITKKTNYSLVYYKKNAAYFEVDGDTVYVNYQTIMSVYHHAYQMPHSELDDFLIQMIHKYLRIDVKQVAYPERILTPYIQHNFQ